MQKKINSIVAIIFCLNLILSPLSVLAQEKEFNKDFIISDEEMMDHDSMSAHEIDIFLKEKDGFLAGYSDPRIRMQMPQFISLVSSLNKINPKYALVLLQKEQGLITNKNPKQTQLDWATGYGCPDNSVCDYKYKGLANQIDWGVGSMRYYMNHANEFKYQVGQTYTIDGQRVTMLNDATRSLYTYTPHIHGNELFFDIWEKWFGNHEEIEIPTEDEIEEIIEYFYKDGMVVFDEESEDFWLIQNNTKRKFATKATFLSRSSLNKAVIAKKEELEKYKTGNEIKYPNYSLLQTPDKKIYLIDGNILRHIEDEKAFKLIGFNPEEIIKVPEEDISDYTIGDPITVASAYPTGALLQDKVSGGIYFVQEGKKYPIWDRELVSLYYQNLKITPASADELGKYLTQKPIKLQDGELITSENNPKVYLISEGRRLAIHDEKTFNELGFKWSNVKQVGQKIMNLHTPGTQIKID
jgi:hypothetical protein